ncbi:hypothetical protein IFM89_023726 [Coptis chinensis]|uniref:Glutaminyl-peptide cyclotransferase n=1 Tax=Coptis chinensis TaxID=261450 RepID=A0A835IF77_9MAGN|nr:hypothetical protein IFM89_023726 [Coptis chinensis]
MANSLSKRRTNKRPSLHNSSSSSPSPPTMTKRYFLLSLCFLLSVFFILFITLKLPKKTTSIQPFPSSHISSIQVVNQFPHDPNAFTQGLLYAGNDTLFESTGLYGQSSIRKVVIRTGKVEVLQEMDSSDFGEGLTLLGDSHQMRDGWGLATDGKVLFGSDGSSTLYHLSPQTFKVIEKAIVKYHGYEVHNLNELEYVNGEVWANVWSTDCIARISPKDGIVLGWILLPTLREQLFQAGNREIDVLNGIAWDSEKNRLLGIRFMDPLNNYAFEDKHSVLQNHSLASCLHLSGRMIYVQGSYLLQLFCSVTGKLWSKLFEIKLHPVKDPFHDSIKQVCLRGSAQP